MFWGKALRQPVGWGAFAVLLSATLGSAYASPAPTVGSPAPTVGSQDRNIKKLAAINSSADAFSQGELKTLVSGGAVKRKFMIRRGYADYYGGYSYRLLRTTPLDVFRALRRPGGIARAIPYGVEARVLSENDGISRMRIVQGKQPVVGTYTVKVKWDLAQSEALFWLDPGERHDVHDLWGVFRARELQPGWTLVSFGFAFKIGGIGSFLEPQAQIWGLSTADRIAKMLPSTPKTSPIRPTP